MRHFRAMGLTAAVLTVSAGSAAFADDRSTALLKEAQEATAKATSLQADVVLDDGDSTLKGKLILKRPNLARIELQGGERSQTVISDGKSLYTYVPAEKEYRKDPVAAAGQNVGALWLHQARGFFRWTSLVPNIPNATSTYLGKQTLEGAGYEVVQIAFPGENEAKLKYFISDKDRLVHRMEQSYVVGGSETKVSATLKNVKVNAPTQAAAFQWKTPANAKLATVPDYEKGLLAVGKPAPDFDLDRPGGGRLALNQAIKDKKATLINFWFYG